MSVCMNVDKGEWVDEREDQEEQEDEEEDEVFPRVGVAPPVSSLPDKVHTHPLLPPDRELNKQPTVIQSQIALYKQA